MWFDTLILQLRLHMAYRVNGILYRLRFLRLPYENSFAKTLGLVLAVLREIFGILLGKLLYMAVFFAAPLLLIRRELPPELYGHLLVFLTLIGGIFNNSLLDGGTDTPTDYLVLPLAILAMSVFFSVHYLVLYYLLQPYTAGLENTSFGYRLITGLTYFVCYMISTNVHGATVAFGIGMIVFAAVYVAAALLLAYRLAPKTFRLRT